VVPFIWYQLRTWLGSDRTVTTFGKPAGKAPVGSLDDGTAVVLGATGVVASRVGLVGVDVGLDGSDVAASAATGAFASGEAHPATTQQTTAQSPTKDNLLIATSSPRPLRDRVGDHESGVTAGRGPHSPAGTGILQPGPVLPFELLDRSAVAVEDASDHDGGAPLHRRPHAGCELNGFGRALGVGLGGARVTAAVGDGVSNSEPSSTGTSGEHPDTRQTPTDATTNRFTPPPHVSR
jgi:hypothetical protein